MNKRNSVKKGIVFSVMFIAIFSFAGCMKSDNTVTNTPFESQEASSVQQKKQKENTWHDVISFSGTSDKNTQPFSIQGKQWRIKWSFQDSREFGDETNGLFIIQIYRVGESVITDVISHNGLSASDTDYIYEGEGEFYFKISMANAKSWSIIIEDLY